MLNTGSADVALVAGDFNTFEDRNGAPYSALVSAGQNRMVDVRDVPGVLELDCGRGGDSWEGWETDHWSRANIGAGQRYDQIFINANPYTSVVRTAVVEERYGASWQEEAHWVYASDHLPVVVELILKQKPGTRKPLPPPPPPPPPRTLACLITMALIMLFFLGILLWQLWESFGGKHLECRFECRDVRYHPPFNQEPVNCTAAEALVQLLTG